MFHFRFQEEKVGARLLHANCHKTNENQFYCAADEKFYDSYILCDRLNAYEGNSVCPVTPSEPSPGSQSIGYILSVRAKPFSSCSSSE